MSGKMSAKDFAAKFKAKCDEYGFEFSVGPMVVKIWKKIPIGDGKAFGEAEMEASIIFDYAPLKGGSVWGTDGGSIGGATAMKTGVFKMNKSGSGKSFVSALALMHPLVA